MRGRQRGRAAVHRVIAITAAVVGTAGRRGAGVQRAQHATTDAVGRRRTARVAQHGSGVAAHRCIWRRRGRRGRIGGAGRRKGRQRRVGRSHQIRISVSGTVARVDGEAVLQQRRLGCRARMREEAHTKCGDELWVRRFI